MTFEEKMEVWKEYADELYWETFVKPGLLFFLEEREEDE